MSEHHGETQLVANLEAKVTEALDLLKELFSPDWAVSEGNRQEMRLHRRVARLLVDNGRLAESWKEWLDAHE
jgi:hypothetical protein